MRTAIMNSNLMQPEKHSG